MASETPDKKIKWTAEAERDLLMIMLCAGSTGGNVTANWQNVENGMKRMGYEFTKSAINQRFGKVVMKKFKETYGDRIVAEIAGTSSDGAGSSKAASKTTPRSAKRASDTVKNENDDGTPSKKPRGKKVAAVKKDDPADEDLPIKPELGGPVKDDDPEGLFEGFLPPIDQDEEYAAWLAEQKTAGSASQDLPVFPAEDVDEAGFMEWMAGG